MTHKPILSYIHPIGKRVLSAPNKSFPGLKGDDKVKVMDVAESLT